MNKYIIVMKVGPHSNMSLNDIIDSKNKEEQLHGVHFWGYSGVFCHPKDVQNFCKKAFLETGKNPSLILLETKSNYTSDIGFITKYSIDNESYKNFEKPVQLQGAKYSFVCKNIRTISNFNIDNYVTIGGKNNLKPLKDHLKYRVNKSFAMLIDNFSNDNCNSALEVELVEPYAIYLKE